MPVIDANHAGLLGRASIMTVTSYPNRTAPTIRGKWVLLQILGTPPPPPDTPPLEEAGRKAGGRVPVRRVSQQGDRDTSLNPRN